MSVRIVFGFTPRGCRDVQLQPFQSFLFARQPSKQTSPRLGRQTAPLPRETEPERGGHGDHLGGGKGGGGGFWQHGHRGVRDEDEVTDGDAEARDDVEHLAQHVSERSDV